MKVMLRSPGPAEDFLLREKVVPWSEMPLWMPEEAARHLQAFSFINAGKAIDSGLTFRSLSDTVRDVLAWREPDRDEELKAGIDSDREERLLRKWHEEN